MTQYIQHKFAIEICLAVITSLGVLGLLFYSKPLKLSKHPEDKMFRRLCWILLVYAVFGMLQDYQIFYKAIPYYMLPAHLLRYLPDFILLFLSMQWLVFVDLAVTHSPEGVKRRCRFVWVPLAIMVISLALGYSLLLNVHAGIQASGAIPELEDRYYTTWSWINYGIAMFIYIAYFLSAFRIVHYHNTERKQPLFLRLDVFIIPWVIALIVQNIPGIYLVIDVPCAAISLLLTYHSMRNRYRYMDYETELYNEEFLDFFESFAKKLNYSGGCAIAFTVSGDAKKFADVLMQYKPERSMAVRMKDGRFIILANLNNKSAVKCFIDLIKEAVKETDPEIEISTFNWFQERKESPESFAKRVLDSVAI